MEEYKKRLAEEEAEPFREQIKSFLADVAPGSKGSKTVAGMPNVFVGCLCDRITGFFKMVYNFARHKALWQTHKVFKPLIDKDMAHPDGTPKKFSELGRDADGNLKISLACTTTDLGRACSLVFTNEISLEERRHFVESEHRKVLNRDDDVTAALPIMASCAIPFAFTPVLFPETAKRDMQTSLCDGGAVSNLSAQLLRQVYYNEDNTKVDRRKLPVRFALSCNEFEHKRDVAYDYDEAPPVQVRTHYDLAMQTASSVIGDGMADDVDIFVANGGRHEHIFVTRLKEIENLPTPDAPFMKKTPSQVNFFALNRKTTKQMFDFGRYVVEEKLIKNMDKKEFKRAQRNGVTLALSGGGSLFPVLFGAVVAMNEYFEIHAMAGTSAGALTASYMAEMIARRDD